MYASYKSGIFVFFAIDSQFQWRIAFSSNKWNLVPGRSYRISYTIDTFAPNVAIAMANSSTYAIAELPATSNVFQQFRVGHLLVVSAEGETFQFRLDGTARALSELLRCAQEGKVRTAGSRPLTQGFSNSGSGRPTEVVEREAITAEERLEATRIVANLLASGELRDYKMMTGSELNDPDMPQEVKAAAVAWKAEGSIGLLHILPRSAGDVDTLVALVIASDAKACNGDFASGKVPDIELPKIRRAFTSCQVKKDGGSSIEYIFVPRANGLVYRFATINSRSESRQKVDSDGLRNAIKQVVLTN